MRRTWIALALVSLFALLVVLFDRDPTPHGAADVAPAPDHVVRDEPARARLRGAAPRDAPNAESGSPTSASSRVVRGTVSAHFEGALAEAEVRLFAVDAARPTRGDVPVADFSRALGTARTSAEGRFEIRDVPPGALIAQAVKVGYEPSAEVVDADDIELTLEPGWPVRFRVSDVRGHPIAGATVALGTAAESLTDDHGLAELVCATRGTVVVEAPGRATAHVDVSDQPDRPIEVVLGEGLAVAGTVVDGTGRPMSGVRVSRRGRRGTFSIAPPTRGDGAFRFDGLDARHDVLEWTLLADAAGFVAEEMEVRPGDLHVRIVMRHAATIRGLVVHADGTPAIGATVWPGGRSTQDGRFRIEGVLPGAAELLARVRSPIDSRMELEGHSLVDVPEGGDVADVRVVVGPPTDESFVLVKVVDGEKPDQAQVMAWKDGVEVGNSSYDGDAAKRDGQVLVKIRQPTGTLVHLGATIEPPRTSTPFDARTTEAVVTEDAPPFTVRELHLGAPGRVRIRAIGPDGAEIPRESLDVVTEAERNDDGTFAVHEVEWFDATVGAPGFAPSSIRFAPPHPPLRDAVVRLVRSARITGRVVAEGIGVDGLFVEIRSGVAGDRAAGAELDATGRFALDAAPGPRCELRVSSGGDVILLRQVEVAEGATDLGDLLLEKSGTWQFIVTATSGARLGGAIVTACDCAGARIAGTVTATRPDGSVETLVPVSPAPRVLVSKTGFATRVVDPAPDAPQPVRIVLHPAGSVRVRIAKRADAGWGELSARLPGTSITWEPHWARGSLVTGNVYDDLPPGPVDLVLTMRDREVVKRVDVVAGQVVDVVFGE